MTYVLSDIHGNLQRFELMTEQIDLRSDDTLYILGDVIDRGMHGIGILQRIMTMPNVKMLLGNHEYMMMRALGFPYDGEDDIRGIPADKLTELWYRNGGGVTHSAWKKLLPKERSDIRDYLRSLPLNIDITVNGGRYRLVHAASEEMYYKLGDTENETKTCYCVWDREAVFEMQETDRTVIFGHTPTVIFQKNNPMEIFYKDNLIGIDCGCGIRSRVMSGVNGTIQSRLACLRLDDMKEFYTEDRRKKS